MPSKYKSLDPFRAAEGSGPLGSNLARTGLIVGASENVGEVYLGGLLGYGLQNWIPYVVALIVLLIRPSGLFGQKTVIKL